MLDSLKIISVDSHWCPLNQFILQTQELILFNFAKYIDNCQLSHDKVVKGSWVARMGRNFDDYPSFQPMRSWVNTYAKDCIRLYLFEIVKYEVPHKSYIVPKEVHTIVDMTKRKKETQSRHEFMCNYTLIDGFFLRPSFWDEPLHFFHGALPKACTWVAVPLKYLKIRGKVVVSIICPSGWNRFN